MHRVFLASALLLSTGFVIGCSDRPHNYGEQRPPVDRLSEDDRGLQSKDVVDASDKMAQSLLADHDLNASKTRWTVVVSDVENKTSDPTANLNIFLDRLRAKLAEYGHDRVSLIENKATYHELQSKELEGGGGDAYGQGDSHGSNVPYRGIQPDYALYATISDMPNRSTNYYFCEFKITDYRTREIVWDRSYEVKVAR